MTPSAVPVLASFYNFGGPDLLLVLFFCAFPTWMVIDCLTRESSQGNDRVVWLLVIILIPLGSLIYFFFRKLRRRSSPPAA
jgi:hypothetical protein